MCVSCGCVRARVHRICPMYDAQLRHEKREGGSDSDSVSGLTMHMIIDIYQYTTHVQ
jgi:NAD-dependent dihydropyrimidine dehydrogenase PreA subunit